MIITILLFVLILGVIVFFHELGHFITAKKYGMGVEEFGFGFPPRIFGIQKNNEQTNKKTKWKIIKGNKTPETKDGEKSSTIYSIGGEQRFNVTFCCSCDYCGEY